MPFVEHSPSDPGTELLLGLEQCCFFCDVGLRYFSKSSFSPLWKYCQLAGCGMEVMGRFTMSQGPRSYQALDALVIDVTQSEQLCQQTNSFWALLRFIFA